MMLGTAPPIQPFLADSWPLLVPVVLGLVAVYLLLPRPHGYPTLWGAVIGGLALLWTGWWLIRIEAALPEQILFYAFSAIAIVSGVLLIVQRNPVRAALSFALVVLSTCGLFLLQAAPFLMAATTIVYAGAIVVTFLFVIMLAQQEGRSDADHRSREPFLSTLASFVLLGALLYVLHLTYDTRALDELLARTDRAVEQPSVEAVRQAVGDEETFFDAYRREAERLSSVPDSSQPLKEMVEDVADSWNKPGVDVVELKQLLRGLSEAGHKARNTYGRLQPRESTLRWMSSFSAPPDLAAPENVAPLGRSLFTDYVLAVELAGTLLLVATIGAIAIAGRRTEGLR